MSAAPLDRGRHRVRRANRARRHHAQAGTGSEQVVIPDGGTGATRARGEAAARELLDDLIELRQDVVREGQELLQAWRPALRRRAFLPSAVNLAHYIALRRRDVRALQEELMPLGLSSLGRCEGRVLANIDAVIAALARIAGAEEVIAVVESRPNDFYRGNRLLRRHTDAVFGRPAGQREVRIMVTLPAEAQDYGFVRELVERGADVVRINCAHDTAEAWAAMARTRAWPLATPDGRARSWLTSRGRAPGRAA